MKILFDYGVGGEPEGSPPTFKQCAAADIHAAFLNPTEHGEVRTIRYDGVEYEDITVIENCNIFCRKDGKCHSAFLQTIILTETHPGQTPG